MNVIIHNTLFHYLIVTMLSLSKKKHKKTVVSVHIFKLL